MANKGRAEAGKALEAARVAETQKQLRIGRRPRRSRSRSRNLRSGRSCSETRSSSRRRPRCSSASGKSNSPLHDPLHSHRQVDDVVRIGVVLGECRERGEGG
eukprot:scaffold40176_cov54-Phaeocystis_antarctica.AAC.2